MIVSLIQLFSFSEGHCVVVLLLLLLLKPMILTVSVSPPADVALLISSNNIFSNTKLD